MMQITVGEPLRDAQGAKIRPVVRQDGRVLITREYHTGRATIDPPPGVPYDSRTLEFFDNVGLAIAEAKKRLAVMK